jgi:solute carrier family 13 (sodium-dependent dicarboxylate transporter), member 2/3/5
VNSTKTRWLWLAVAAAALAAFVLMPQPAGLSATGQCAIGVLLFAVVVWVSEAVSYPVSAAMIVALGGLTIGLAPGADGRSLGTARALGMFLEGFASTAVAVVGGALVIAAAMKHTGLDRRVAIAILKRTGTGPRGILAGALLVGIVLSFFVPSTTARVGAVVPIMGGWSPRAACRGTVVSPRC